MQVREKSVVYADALRLVAILAVVLNHFAFFTNVTFHGRAHNFSWIGIWGVDCFFVLTGFLLSRRFFEAILGRKPFPSLKAFFTRRLLRIYPLYFVALSISIVVANLVRATPSVADIVTHLTLTHGFFPQFIDDLDGPLWTMSVDAQCYIVLPLLGLAAMALARGRTESQRVRLIWSLLAFIVVASVVERFVALSATMKHATDWKHFAVASRNVIGMGADFAFGAALAFLELRRPVPGRSQRWYGASIALGVAFLVVLARSPLASTQPMTVLYTNTFTDLLGGLSAAALLYGTLRGRFEWLTLRLNSRLVVHGAELAYAIYLFHYLIIKYAAQSYRGSLGAPLTALFFSAAVFLIVLAVAEAGHRLVERPGLLLRDRQSRERSELTIRRAHKRVTAALTSSG